MMGARLYVSRNVAPVQHHLQEEEGLSPRTIRSLHAVIRQGLAYAHRTGAATRNAADLVVLPKMEDRKVAAMSGEEAKRFLEAAKADRYYALWCVLLTGGLRPGAGPPVGGRGFRLEQAPRATVAHAPGCGGVEAGPHENEAGPAGGGPPDVHREGAPGAQGPSG